MITESASRRLLLTTLTCMVLFLISCDYAYAQRGYLAVGGEYVFCLIPLFALAYEWLRGGEVSRVDRTAHAAPSDRDARKLAAPEDPEEGRVCGDCLFCKEAGGLLACVVEAYDAEDEDEMHDAVVHVVGATQGACDQWVDSES